MKTRLKEIPNAKIKYYKNSIIGLWTPTILILLAVLFTEITFQEIGFALPTVNTEPFGPVITYIILVIGLLYFLSILFMIIGYHASAAFKEKLAQTLKKEQQKMAFSAILPTTKKEKRLWNFVSLTAGITEEIIYRGFLIFAFSYLFPNLSIGAVIFLASLLFGLAHTYQGASGVIRTMAIGVFFSLLYVSLGSILPLIVFHFLIDYVGKLGD